MNKRGLSTKNSLLIIAIIIVLIVLVLLISFSGKFEKKDNSLIKRVELDLEIKKVKVQEDSSVKVSVKRDVGQGNLTGIRLVFQDESNYEIVDLNYTLSQEQQVDFQIILKKVSPEKISNVKIFPIVGLETGELVIGSLKDEYKIKKRKSSNIITNYNEEINYENGNNQNINQNYQLNDSGNQTQCTDNCSSLGYECGNWSVCGLGINCGICSELQDFGEGFVCSSGKCVQEQNCFDNCNTYNYECGNWSVCGSETNCGTCSEGFVCNVSGMCEIDCQDNCSILGYECGMWPICGETTNCSVCGEGFVCNVSGMCEEEYTCQDTCESFGYECGTKNICGEDINCGTCSGLGEGFLCNISGMCEEICTDTCLSLGYECGSQLVCDSVENCGTCNDGEVCTSDTCNAGTCEFNLICGSDGNCCESQGCADDPDCPEPWETGIVSWWSFNTNANDDKGSNHGIVNGATHTSSGCKFSGCYYFDGNNDYIDVGDFSMPGDKLTISAWVKWEASSFDLDPRIISKAHGSETNEHVFLLGLDDFSSGAYAQYRFRFTAGGSVLSHNQGTVYPNTGWYHIVGVYDGTTSEIYVNGVSQGTQSKTGTLTENSNAVNIARNPVVSDGDYRYWNGKLDEIMIWNRALNSSEINDIYNYF